MKAISLWQPWASFVAERIKKFETRSFKTKYRGLMVIQAAKTNKGMKIYSPQVGDIIKNRLGEDYEFPFGSVLCIVNLMNVYEAAEKIKDPGISDEEIAVGDWTKGRFVWELGMIKKFEKPIPAKGGQGFWNWDEK